MSNPILEGMIRKRSGHIIACKDRPDQFNVEKEAMRAALLWLADNVSDEMVRAAQKAHEAADFYSGERGWMKASIAAALRAAAGDGK